MTLIEAALKYVGKREKPGNKGFEDPELEARMIAIGWQAPWPYCILGVKMVYVEAEPSKVNAHKLFSANCQDTFENFLKAGYQITMAPRPGSIVIWEYWKDGFLTTKGHGGLVIKQTPGGFESFEGNTDGPGGREGDGFYVKARSIVRTPATKGSSLIVKGFIHLS